MKGNIKYITSESVSEGHPDKVADQISDAILDFFLTHDKKSHVAIETMVTTDNVIVAGEIRSSVKVNGELEGLVRSVIKDVGYESFGFDWRNLKITFLLHEQSEEIYHSVSQTNHEGAGDQGVMFGYATNETAIFMPSSIYYANHILQNIINASKQESLPKLGPDGKSQVTIRYLENKVQRVDNIVVSLQHPVGLSAHEIKNLIYPYILSTVPENIMCAYESIMVNPSGSFIKGGPAMDCGLTGRKIVVDTYGGAIPHGGGAFSGKDPTKVDRSAAYMARYIAKNIVASELAERCLISLAYAIGMLKPTMVHIETFGTEIVPINVMLNFINNNVDLSVSGIKNHLRLESPIYRKTTTYGHFGKNPEKDGSFSWEKLDLVASLKKNLYPASSTQSLFYASNRV